MSDKEVYYIEIICIIFLLGFIVFFYYMAIANKENNTTNEIHVEPPIKKIIKDYKEHEIKVRCPPKLVNLYDEETKFLPNKNDLDIINKTRLNMYNSNYDIDNVNFNKEVISLDDIKTREQRKFDNELEKVYTTDLVENQDPNYDYNQIFDYSLKPHKGDLPIANIPLCTLKDSSKSLKLSDRFKE